MKYIPKFQNPSGKLEIWDPKNFKKGLETKSDYMVKPIQIDPEIFRLYQGPSLKAAEIIATPSTPKYRDDPQSRKEDVQKIPGLNPSTMSKFPSNVQKEYMNYRVSERPDYEALKEFVNFAPMAVGPLPFIDSGLALAGKGAMKLVKKAAPSMTNMAQKLDNIINTKKFKSEIDWGNWNSEIPKNTELMKEYNAIEESTKKAGTWMKNEDGSRFEGFPELFIQINSNNFKKAFPEGYNNVFRGASGRNLNRTLVPGKSMFTADLDLAKLYASSGISNTVDFIKPTSNFYQEGAFLYNKRLKNGVFDLAHKKSKNSIEFDNYFSDWTKVNLINPERNLDNIKAAITRLEKELKEDEAFLATGKQGADGYWRFPSNPDVVYSNTDYMNATLYKRNWLDKYRTRFNTVNNTVINEEGLSKMKQVLGDVTETDDIAKYIEDNDLDFVKINNIEDGWLGDVIIVNHKKGNYLKSLRGNNGMFDMTNPDIYKGLIPAAGLYGLTPSKKPSSEPNKM